MHIDALAQMIIQKVPESLKPLFSQVMNSASSWQQFTAAVEQTHWVGCADKTLNSISFLSKKAKCTSSYSMAAHIIMLPMIVSK